MAINLEDFFTGNLKDAPQLSFLFDVFLPNDNNDFMISQRVQKVELPFDKIEAEAHPHGNSKIYFAKSDDLTTLSLDILEAEDGQTELWINKWMSTVKNTDGTYNLPITYQRSIEIMLLKADAETISKHYKLFGVTPLGIQQKTFDYTDNSVVIYTVEFQPNSVEVI